MRFQVRGGEAWDPAAAMALLGKVADFFPPLPIWSFPAVVSPVCVLNAL